MFIGAFFGFFVWLTITCILLYEDGEVNRVYYEKNGHFSASRKRYNVGAILCVAAAFTAVGAGIGFLFSLIL